MKKEVEALNRMVSFDKKCEFIPQQLKDDFQLIEQALKRNEQVRLLALDDNYGMVEAKSAEDYNCDAWYCPMGYCPICGAKNPIANNFCGNCGQRLEERGIIQTTIPYHIKKER